MLTLRFWVVVDIFCVVDSQFYFSELFYFFKIYEVLTTVGSERLILLFLDYLEWSRE